MMNWKIKKESYDTKYSITSEIRITHYKLYVTLAMIVFGFYFMIATVVDGIEEIAYIGLIFAVIFFFISISLIYRINYFKNIIFLNWSNRISLNQQEISRTLHNYIYEDLYDFEQLRYLIRNQNFDKKIESQFLIELKVIEIEEKVTISTAMEDSAIKSFYSFLFSIIFLIQEMFGAAIWTTIIGLTGLIQWARMDTRIKKLKLTLEEIRK